MSDLMDYIRIQWDDIHHSRNQEWKYFTIISGSIATAVGVALWRTDIDVAIRIAFLIFSLILCIMGGYITYAHWIIFYGKRVMICNLERKLGIHVALVRAPISVQGMIFLFHFWFAAILVGIILWLSTGKLSWAILGAAIIYVGGFISTLILSRKLRIRFAISSTNTANYPLFAKQVDLESCLGYLRDRPLKLVANSLYSDEVVWEKLRWSFQADSIKDGIMNKKLFLNPRDDFQISAANQNSRQAFHSHKKLYEIYISSSEVKCEYLIDTRTEVDNISQGILIIPPGVIHKVTLNGITYVIQFATDSGTVSDDKELHILDTKK